MKKTLLLLSVLFLSFSISLAIPISEGDALRAAQLFFDTKNNIQEADKIKLAFKSTSIKLSQQNQIQNVNLAYYYVFNKGDNAYVIIAGDDASHPILAYSNEGIFNPNNIPPNTAKWIEGYKEQIRYIITHNLEADDVISKEWSEIGNKNWNINQIQAGVSPLIKTKWDQSPYYNALCPYDYNEQERTVTGCVATAMAQIMKYWNYPATGSGIHSYNHPNYGILSANFGTTNYNWNAMPTSITSPNNAVATLMYHCGVSIEMFYGTSSEGGSAAYSEHIENALKTYFGYDSIIENVIKRNYSDSEWINLLKSELTSGRPCEYSGGYVLDEKYYGHSFVCDGFDNNGYFHFNWGWGGSENGYFLLNKLNPGKGGIGSGEGTYNENQRALIGIQPPSNQINYDLQLYDDVSVSDSQIFYTSSFTVNTNVENKGTTTFDGDYCAGIFDENNNFVDFVEILSNINQLPPNYHFTNNLTFSSDGLVSMVPGKYKIYVFYRPKDGEWKQIRKESWDWFTDEYTEIEVINENPIMLNSKIYTDPENSVVQGEPLNVIFDIVNKNTFTFKGSIAVGLLDIYGDSFEVINILNETNGLPPDYHYTDGLSFSTENIDVEPGTYYVVGYYKYENNDNWYWIGSQGSFVNPNKIVVTEKPLNPDVYETNNTVATAKKLTLQFSSNTASVITEGSNIHINNDVDYYKIDLPSGYNYNISGWIEDIYSAGQVGGFTLDGVFVYSFDGINWSESFDMELSPEIEFDGQTTIYFKVLPYFLGQTGTYQLDLDIVRTQSSSVIISLSSPLNFESVEIGKSLNKNITIKNMGNSTMNVSNIYFPEGFTGNWKSGSVLAGQSRNIEITFSPTQKKLYSGNIKVTSNATSGTSTLSVNGIGVDPNSVPDLLFSELFRLYPNPSTNKIKISSDRTDKLIKSIQIFDESGKTILTLQFEQTNSVEVNTGSLLSGTYYCQIIDLNGEEQIIKFTVQR